MLSDKWLQRYRLLDNSNTEKLLLQGVLDSDLQLDCDWLGYVHVFEFLEARVGLWVKVGLCCVG